MRNYRLFFFIILPVLFLYVPSLCRAETYTEAITHAQNNIDNNTDFIPTDGSIITITGNPATEDSRYGLTYNSSFGDGKDYLVVRTMTNMAYYENSSGNLRNGVGAYTTYNDGVDHSASWVTTGNDATHFIDNYVSSPATIVTSMEQGLGMNTAAGGTHTAIVEYGILPTNNNLMRPAHDASIQTYPTTPSTYAFGNPFTVTHSDITDPAILARLNTFLNYWQGDTLSMNSWHGMTPSASTDWFPWTELGYTYYWGQASTALSDIQGSSEFIILGGTAIKIIGIYSPQSYMYTKNNGTTFSSAATAEYGNGFASFNITGNCDTVWAGNAFQKNASTDFLSPNQIIVGTGGNISGGQGILVWSTNYTLTNNGTISGATANKLYDAFKGGKGMSGTANVAVLFLGDTTYGDAGGKNIITNSGTISSSGTAIEVDAGDTNITNTGTIYGGNYAILTGAGTDHVDIDSGNVTGCIDLGGGTNDQLDVGSVGNVTMNFFLNRDTRTSSQIVDAENVTLTNNRVTLAVDQTAGSANIRNNDSFLIVNAGSSLTADPTKITVTNDPNLPMVTFAASKNVNQLSLIATRDNTYYTNNCTNSSLGSVLDNLAENGSSGMAGIIGALDDSGSAGNALQLQPAASVSTVNAEIGALNNFGNMFSTQMARLGNDDDNINVYAVNDAEKRKLSVTALDNMLAYNSDSILENSFNRREKWEVFATGFGTMTFQSDKGSTTGYNSAGGGTQFGFYRRVNDSLMLGILAGYMLDSITLNDKSASQDINSVRVGPCGKLLKGYFYATGALTYGYHGVQGDRKVNFGGLNLQADSDYSMNDVSPYFETGYIFHPKKNFEIVPNFSLQYDWMRSSSYNESGAGAADLSVKAFDSNSLVSVIGVRFNGRIQMKNIDFLSEFNVGWQHEYLGRANGVQASFSEESAGIFTTNVNMFDRSTVKAGFAANFIYGKKHKVISLQYNTQIYDSGSNHVFSITSRNYF